MLDNNLKLIEFDKILEIIFKNIKTYNAKNKYINISPYKDYDELVLDLKTTSEMTNFINDYGKLEFEEITDIEKIILCTQKENFILTTEEILEIRKVLSIYKHLFDSIKPYKNKYPLLFNYFKSFEYPIELLRKVDKTIDYNGNILDNASNELKRIRQTKNQIRIKINNILLSIMDRSYVKDTLQDKIITIRDGRYVIPIQNQWKNKLKKELPYLIHSYSQTGETIYIEPEDVVEINNELVEIDGLERQEIFKILKELTSLIAKFSNEILLMYDIIGKIEIIYRKALYSIDNNCTIPEIIKDEKFIILYDAKHPLLIKNCVPINIEVGKNFTGLIISGPNAGGKTVSLKIVGLLTTMILSGIPIPCSSKSKIGFFNKIMVEIGDEQSISENLSSFSGHIVSLYKILKHADENSLVLIDEITSSTEPKEGEALAVAIISYLAEKNSKFIITTHYPGLKNINLNEFLNKYNIKNACMEFDEENLMPTYKLRINESGSSYAFNIAEKYGLSKDIIELAKRYLDTNSTLLEKQIKYIEQEKNIINRRFSIINKQMEKIKTLKENYENLLNQLKNEKEELKKKKISVLRKELEDAFKEIESLKEKIKEQKLENISKAEKYLENLSDLINISEKEIIDEKYEKENIIKIGNKVFVGTFQKEGIIEEVYHDKVKVRIGIISSIVDINDIYKIKKDHIDNDGKKNISYNLIQNNSFIPKSNSIILDIRGLRAEEALTKLEKFIDNSLISGNEVVYVIHGIGEGVLRKIVWDYLKTRNEIKEFFYAKPEDGGQGKTIVIFK